MAAPVLEFDLGNTLAKWRVIEKGHVVERGVATDLAALRIPMGGIGRVRVASVVTETREQILTDWSLSKLGLAPEFARSMASCAGVTNVYAEPERLGVDRWLAMIAAFQRFKRPVVVIDAGTALTVDYVDGEGKHLGGYILSGLQLGVQALIKDTSRIAVSDVVEPSCAPGCSTAEAVVQGGYFAATAIITAARKQAGALFSQRAAVVLTGGDSEVLQALMPAADDVCLSPDLVFDGLAWALP